MKIIQQWTRHEGIWGVSMLGAFYSKDFWGFVLLGIVFEWPRTSLGRDIHKNGIKVHQYETT